MLAVGYHRLVRSLAVVALLSAMGAGCTFLIAFDDPLPPLEAGVDAEPYVPDVIAPPPPPPADARADVDIDALASCEGLVDGHYCGTNLLKGYPFADDLVRCTGGRISNVKICTRRCLHLRNPHPDQCDECATKPLGGFFCGREMPGWGPDGGPRGNGDLKVHCQSNATDDVDYSCTSCTPKTSPSGAGAATCP